MKSPVSHLVFYERQVPPAKEWEYESRGWSFLQVRQGSGVLLGVQPPQMLEEGQTLMLSPGQRCVLRASYLGTMQWDWFFVMPELLAGILSPIETQQLQEYNQGPVLRVFPPNHPHAQQFREATTHSQAKRHMQARCAMLSLSAELLREFLPQEPERPQLLLTAEDRLEALLRSVPAATLQGLSVQEAAQRCGCSVRHFSRLFKKRFGTSLLAKQIELRLQRARQLLAESDAKIIEVAMESGFQHVGLFTAMFKRRFGMPPSRWRQRHRSGTLAGR